MNGSHLGQTTTDAIGDFRLLVAKPLDANTYLISASFNGASHIAPASSYFNLKYPANQGERSNGPTGSGNYLHDGRESIRNWLRWDG